MGCGISRLIYIAKNVHHVNLWLLNIHYYSFFWLITITAHCCQSYSLNAWRYNKYWLLHRRKKSYNLLYNGKKCYITHVTWHFPFLFSFFYQVMQFSHITCFIEQCWRSFGFAFSVCKRDQWTSRVTSKQGNSDDLTDVHDTTADFRHPQIMIKDVTSRSIANESHGFGSKSS